MYSKNRTHYQVVGIGNALVDSEFEVSDGVLAQTGLTKGNMTLASLDEQAAIFLALKEGRVASVKQSGGGSAANSLAAFSGLGGSCYYHCRVGDDKLGAFYLSDLANLGVITDKTFAQVAGMTGTCAVLVSQDGERTMQTHLGVSSLIDETNVNFETLMGADWLYLEGYLAMSPSIATAVIQLRQQAGIRGVKIAVSFADPAVVKFAKEGLLTLLGNGVEVIFCNLQEAQLFTDKKQHKACARALCQYADIAVVTNGGEPTIIAKKEGGDILIIESPVSSLDGVLDTNGAGDNYAGAFLYALNEHYSLEECASLASAVAGRVVCQFGARLDKTEYNAIKQEILAKSG